jgi:hypothetical protein
MKKILVLVSAAAGLAWLVGRSKAAQKSTPPADPWAQASDRV